MSHESQGELTSYLEEQSSEWDTKRLETALQEEINKNKVHLCIHPKYPVFGVLVIHNFG